MTSLEMDNVQNNHMTKIFTLLFLVIIIFPLGAQSAEECRWINVRPGLYCSTEIGNIEWQSASAHKCANNSKNPYNYQCCCGPHLTEPKVISKKLIIISSVVGFFTLITILVFAFKRNE